MKRKFDAVTAPLKLLSHPTFADVGVPMEWTNTKSVTTMRYHSSSRSPVFHDKILQLLYNIKSVYAETPTADYRLGFGVMHTTAYLILVNHESVHVVQLNDCWGSRGRAEFASLANIILGLHLPSVGFSRFFSHQYTPSRGLAEQAVRILALGPNTQDVCKLQLSKDITEVEIIPVECCPPIVRGPHSSRNRAIFAISAFSAGGINVVEHLCPQLSLADASPLRQMWIVWKLLAPEESGNVREVAVTNRLLQNAATLPSHILDHIALHVESRRFAVNDRGAFLPSNTPRVDVAFVTILVPPCHKDRRYRSLIDKKHPPTIRQLVTAFSRLTQVVFAVSDCGINLRGIAPSNVLHVDGEVLVWDLANATFSEYPRSSAKLPTDPEGMCGQGLRSSKTFPASVYTDLKSSIITFVATIARAFEECTDEETRQVWRPFGFGKTFDEINSTPLLALSRNLLFTMNHHQENSDVPTPLEYIERCSAPLAKFFEIILDKEPSADTEAAMRALPSRLLVEVLAPNDATWQEKLDAPLNKKMRV